MTTYADILQIIGPIFLIIAVGWVLRKLNILKSEADVALVRLLINFLLPCLMIKVIVGNPALLLIENVVVPPVMGAAIILLGYAASYLATIIGKIDGLAARRSFIFCCGIQNYSYIPLPIILAFFGQEVAGVLFSSSLGAELTVWSVGAMIMGGVKGRFQWRHAINVPIIAISLAVMLNFARAATWIPSWVQQTYVAIAACAVPLALLITGAIFADYAIPQHLWSGKRVMIFSSIIRLGLMPLCILGLARWLPLDTDLRAVLLVQAAMPAAVGSLAICRHYNGDLATAMKVVLTTTVIGLVTIPFWLQVGMKWLGF